MVRIEGGPAYPASLNPPLGHSRLFIMAEMCRGLRGGPPLSQFESGAIFAYNDGAYGFPRKKSLNESFAGKR